MKSVLISIKPKWCELIANGKKTIEVRKTRPKYDTPFKCFIYCTKNGGDIYSDGKSIVTDNLNVLNKKAEEGFSKTSGFHKWNGKIIGEFVCKNMTCIQANIDYQGEKHLYNIAFIDNRICLSDKELFNYIYDGKRNEGWGWHISDLVIYDKPKELSEFRKPVICHRGIQKDNCNGCWDCEIKSPPQSWCYTEILN